MITCVVPIHVKSAARQSNLPESPFSSTITSGGEQNQPVSRPKQSIQFSEGKAISSRIFRICPLSAMTNRSGCSIDKSQQILHNEDLWR
jgi:hypothetical protein